MNNLCINIVYNEDTNKKTGKIFPFYLSKETSELRTINILMIENT